jgi:hypothetical protein
MFNFPRQRLRRMIQHRYDSIRKIQEWWRGRKEARRIEYVRREWKVVFRDKVRRAIPKLQVRSREWRIGCVSTAVPENTSMTVRVTFA